MIAFVQPERLNHHHRPDQNINHNRIVFLTGRRGYENCTKDYECAKQCVRANQMHYGQGCLLSLQSIPGNENKKSLTCADYGKMHFAGHQACAQDTPDIREYMARLSNLCDCESESHCFKHSNIHRVV